LHHDLLHEFVGIAEVIADPNRRNASAAKRLTNPPLSRRVRVLGLVFRAVGRSLLNPVVLSPIIGIAVALLRIPLTDSIREAFTLIGQATGGVAPFLTGLTLSSQPLLLTAT
jgi:predicted permease